MGIGEKETQWSLKEVLGQVCPPVFYVQELCEQAYRDMVNRAGLRRRAGTAGGAGASRLQRAPEHRGRSAAKLSRTPWPSAAARPAGGRAAVSMVLVLHHILIAVVQFLRRGQQVFLKPDEPPPPQPCADSLQDLYPSPVVRHGMVWVLVEGAKHGASSPWAVPRDLRSPEMPKPGCLYPLPFILLAFTKAFVLGFRLNRRWTGGRRATWRIIIVIIFIITV
ncbi:hypothetical protein J1605_001391 [Eschrichtius robustus]|uniref:Uncharacterized protein n=1 Tax=Eschrichtius robustus TaxID=9764 RepID=A0AB34HZP7_ESCRO|nr:hypothetical protein J1605_001391 [Eschrichtius robustus]